MYALDRFPGDYVDLRAKIFLRRTRSAIHSGLLRCRREPGRVLRIFGYDFLSRRSLISAIMRCCSCTCIAMLGSLYLLFFPQGLRWCCQGSVSGRATVNGAHRTWIESAGIRSSGFWRRLGWYADPPSSGLADAKAFCRTASRDFELSLLATLRYGTRTAPTAPPDASTRDILLGRCRPRLRQRMPSRPRLRTTSPLGRLAEGRMKSHRKKTAGRWPPMLFGAGQQCLYGINIL